MSISCTIIHVQHCKVCFGYLKCKSCQTAMLYLYHELFKWTLSPQGEKSIWITRKVVLWMLCDMYWPHILTDNWPMRDVQARVALALVPRSHFRKKRICLCEIFMLMRLDIAWLFSNGDLWEHATYHAISCKISS